MYIGGDLTKMVHVTYENIRKILKAHDKEVSIGPPDSELEYNELKKALVATVKPDNQAQMAVLGIDVYRYSQQTDSLRQSLVPFVLRMLYRTTWAKCCDESPYLFQKCKGSNYEDQFIDTGDGGYLLLDTPVHALIFAVTFEIFLRLFNSFQWYLGLRTVLGEDVSLRYAMTYGGVFSLETNFYGPSIITNARMLGKDHLNRFLVDEYTFRWFTNPIRGIENIPCVGLSDLQGLPEFQDYDQSVIDKDKGFFFPREGRVGAQSRWKDIDVLKLGDITVKAQTMCVYGLHIHYVSTLVARNDKKKRKIPVTITFGNLNTSGIE